MRVRATRGPTADLYRRHRADLPANPRPAAPVLNPRPVGRLHVRGYMCVEEYRQRDSWLGERVNSNFAQ